MTFRLTQVSDTHLSRARPYFVENFARAARHIRANGCDLVINTGDLSLDGADRPDDLVFARELHDALGVPYRAIPGNHDLGDNRAPDSKYDQFIDERRRDAYRAVLGDDWWMIDHEAWRLIGLDAQLFESGFAAEAEQWEFLDRAFAGAQGRKIAVFTHKPLFVNQEGETPDDWTMVVAPEAVARLRRAIGGADLRLVASGHIHQHRRVMHGPTQHVWAPSSAFILGDGAQKRLAEKSVGLVDYVFHHDRVEIAIVAAEGMIDHDLADFPRAYAPPD